MTKLAPTLPTRKRSKNPEAKRGTGWRFVDQDGLPAPRQFPVFVLRPRVSIVADLLVKGEPLPSGRSQWVWVGTLGGHAGAHAFVVSPLDCWIPIERLRAMVHWIERSQRRGIR